MKNKREEIRKEMEENAKKIRALIDANDELEKEDILLCDDIQWYEEKPETLSVKKDGKKVKETAVIGRVHWNEDFADEDTDDVVTIARSQVVKINGKWQL